MKKFAYLCAMMLLSLNIMAQIDPYDRNWDTIVFDDFDQPNRYFDNTFQDSESLWISFCPRLYPSGITRFSRDGNGNINCSHAVYQWKNCIFDGNDGVLRLNSKFKGYTPMLCPNHPYQIPPPSFGRSFWCDPNHEYLYYYSGTIESLPIVGTKTTIDKDGNEWPKLYGRFRYGYYEIKCQIPIHEGAVSSFWLWDAQDDDYYEEIDVYEFSWSFEETQHNEHGNHHPHGAGNPYCFTTGHYYNDTTHLLLWQNSRARNFPMINDSLSHWHTFACEWLPDHIFWYCDGNVVNEYHNPDSIPQHPLTLKVSYGIDRYAMQGHNSENLPHWTDSSSLVIDYIKVLQLGWDCSHDELIECQTDLANFDYKVKKSVSITSSIDDVIICNTDKVTFRATDSFTITGPFQVNSGGEMTVIMQQCPD